MATLLIALSRPVIGDPVPPLELATLDGRGLSRPALVGTVVDFFATWCIPCQRSLEDLSALRGTLGPRLKIVIIAVEGDVPAVRGYFAAHRPPEGATVALAPDARGTLERLWGADRLPTVFFIDQGLVVRHINRGHGAGFRARAARWLGGLLAAPPS